MIDVVGSLSADVDRYDAADYLHQVFRSETGGILRDTQSQFLVQLVASHPAQTIAAGIEQEVVKQGLSTNNAGRFP